MGTITSSRMAWPWIQNSLKTRQGFPKVVFCCFSKWILWRISFSVTSVQFLQSSDVSRANWVWDVQNLSVPCFHVLITEDCPVLCTVKQLLKCKDRANWRLSPEHPWLSEMFSLKPGSPAKGDLGLGSLSATFTPQLTRARKGSRVAGAAFCTLKQGSQAVLLASCCSSSTWKIQESDLARQGSLMFAWDRPEYSFAVVLGSLKN